MKNLSSSGCWRVVLVALSPWIGACATATQAAPRMASGATASVSTTCDVGRDRSAIRSMAGEFEVSFSFEETEALAAGYSPRGPYRVSAKEVVEIIEDTERKLALQHVLLLEAADGTTSPMKHWRQDWTFEDTDLLEYRGRSTWAHRVLPAAEARCTWSQAVFEVTDGPRYESFGRWSHTGSTSTWTSHETWRPLPRREYTKRSDYDVLLGTNRHVVTPEGWRHEQDNVKWVLATRSGIVRERGVNSYARTPVPAADTARRYLRKTAPFWSAMRAEWRRVFEEHSAFSLQTEVDGKPLYDWLFPLADAAQGDAIEEKIEEGCALVRRTVHPEVSEASRQAISKGRP